MCLAMLKMKNIFFVDESIPCFCFKLFRLNFNKIKLNYLRSCFYKFINELVISLKNLVKSNFFIKVYRQII